MRKETIFTCQNNLFRVHDLKGINVKMKGATGFKRMEDIQISGTLKWKAFTPKEDAVQERFNPGGPNQNEEESQSSRETREVVPLGKSVWKEPLIGKLLALR